MSSSNSTEEWRDVPDYEGLYQASDLGRVKSFGRKVRSRGGFRITKGRILKQCTEDNGRKHVVLCKNTVQESIRVHRLVLFAFVGPPPKDMEGCHNDGNNSNNILSNLRWDTHSENILDSVRHGTKFRPKGELCGMSKLTDEDVINIRAKYASGK